jgi:hypothetical protein
MEYTLNTGRYRSQLMGLLIVTAVTMFGVNHRFGAIGVSFLVFVSLLMWKHKKPYFTTTVEIQTGKKTVFQYLTKPITKTLNESLGER